MRRTAAKQAAKILPNF